SVSGTAALSGVESGDTVTLGGSSTFTFASAGVGTGIAVTVTGYSIGGTDAGNYSLTQPTGLTADITARPITITAGTTSKTYGAAEPALSFSYLIASLVTGDTFTGSLVRAPGETVAGSPYAITQGTLSLGSNYTITFVGANLTITPKTLTVTGATATNRDYDGTTVIAITGGTLAGVVGSDTVTLGGSPAGSVADKNVGTGKAVTVTGYSISGADAANYSIAQPTGLTADITAKALTITGATAANRAYDGTTNATITGATLAGVESGDTVTVTGGGTFADKNVGTSKGVTAALVLAGANAGNYSLTQPTGLSANITAKALTITGLTAVNKIYDRTTAASVSGTAALSGVESGDTVTLGGSSTFTFASAGVG
ncbi:MAG: filamentous hemagglutinin, partial [Planctomycetia bacterium]|nr:filamentous hemagglutinin [Planctomycetia bacterium]